MSWFDAFLLPGEEILFPDVRVTVELGDMVHLGVSPGVNDWCDEVTMEAVLKLDTQVMN